MRKLWSCLVFSLISSSFGSAQTEWTKVDYPVPSSGLEIGLAHDAARGVTILFGDGETWSWNGSSWSQLNPLNSPQRRFQFSMTYDPVRERVVLFGGAFGTTYFDDVWEWDGVDWLRIDPPIRPPARTAASMCWDPATNRVLMFGGWNLPFRQPGPPLGDTWLWDGATWTQAAPGQSPPPRLEPALAGDPQRGVVVLSHGVTSFDPQFQQVFGTDTWEWDGTNWVQVSGSSTVPGGGSAVWDAARQRVVMSAPGARTDLFAWDGAAWSSLATDAGPAYYRRAALAYDSTRGEIVSHGGGSTLFQTWALRRSTSGANTWDMRTGKPATSGIAATASDSLRGGLLVYGGATPDNTPMAEFWRWRDGEWTLLDAEATPGPQAGKAMAFDEIRGEAVLVTPSMDVWTWDGSAWALRPVATRPPQDVRHTVAYDSRRDRLVMLGWVDGDQAGQTWEWDGSNWRRISTSNAPGWPFDGTLSFDRRRGVVVLYDGRLTWEYDGADWLTRSPALVPNGRGRSMIVYDEKRDRTVMFGGTGMLISHTWEWDGSNWDVRPTSAQPGTFNSQIPLALGYEPNSGVTNLLIGREHWQYGPLVPALFESRGTGCAGRAGVPTIRPFDGDLPWRARSFRLDVAPVAPGAAGVVTFGFDDTSWLGLPLPVDLGVAGAPGCFVRAALETSLPTVPVTGGGLRASVVLPSDPTLIGLEAFVQGVLLDPAANTLGVVLSDLGVLRVGSI